jgi:hypothetical protein
LASWSLRASLGAQAAAWSRARLRVELGAGADAVHVAPGATRGAPAVELTAPGRRWLPAARAARRLGLDVTRALGAALYVHVDAAPRLRLRGEDGGVTREALSTLRLQPGASCALALAF